MINFDDLTIGEAKQLAAMFATTAKAEPLPPASEKAQYVIICTEKRGVVFGLTYNPLARPIHLSEARMCLYWSADVGGVFGLAEIGPTKDCKISAVVPTISLEGVTAVMSVDPKAEKAWKSAKVQGR